jgi:hypothetical protein
MWTPQPLTLLCVTQLCVTLCATSCLRTGDDLPGERDTTRHDVFEPLDQGWSALDQEPAELDIAPSLEVDAEPPCTPGSRVGLCALCDEDSNHIMPSSDEACAPIDCSSLDWS